MVASSSPSLLDSVDARAARPAAQGTGRNLGPHPGGGPGLSGRGSLRSSQSACPVFALLAPFCRLELCGSSVAPLRRVGCSSALRIWISVQTVWICADLRGFAWTHAFLSRWGTKAKCSGQAATETQYSRTDRFCMHLRLRGAKCFVNMRFGHGSLLGVPFLRLISERQMLGKYGFVRIRTGSYRFVRIRHLPELQTLHKRAFEVRWRRFCKISADSTTVCGPDLPKSCVLGTRVPRYRRTDGLGRTLAI